MHTEMWTCGFFNLSKRLIEARNQLRCARMVWMCVIGRRYSNIVVWMCVIGKHN